MFFDLIKNRRSIRKFQKKEVEKTKIDTILKAALMSPSSRARRPWEFIAVTDRDLLVQLSQCREHSSEFLKDAPFGIVIIADSSVCDVWIEDTSIAATIIQLSAQSLELSSCWIQVRDRFYSESKKAEDYIKDIFGIPEKYSVECIIAIGYPGEEKLPHDEDKLLFDKLHFDKY